MIPTTLSKAKGTDKNKFKQMGHLVRKIYRNFWNIVNCSCEGMHCVDADVGYLIGGRLALHMYKERWK